MADGDNRTILLVDDDIALLQIGVDVFERYGFRVITAENGEDAIDAYIEEDEKIDLVILDLNMPGMGGDKCLKELLKLNSNLKIIILSGYTDNRIEHKVVSEGAAAFISKPYKLNDMLRVINKIIQKD